MLSIVPTQPNFGFQTLSHILCTRLTYRSILSLPQPPCKQGKRQKASGKPGQSSAATTSTAAPPHHRKHKLTHAAPPATASSQQLPQKQLKPQQLQKQQQQQQQPCEGALGNKRKASSPLMLTSSSENETEVDLAISSMDQTSSGESAEPKEGKRGKCRDAARTSSSIESDAKS